MTNRLATGVADVHWHSRHSEALKEVSSLKHLDRLLCQANRQWGTGQKTITKSCIEQSAANLMRCCKHVKAGKLVLGIIRT